MKRVWMNMACAALIAAALGAGFAGAQERERERVAPRERQQEAVRPVPERPADRPQQGPGVALERLVGADAVDVKVTRTDRGVDLAITSDNPEMIERLHTVALERLEGLRARERERGGAVRRPDAEGRPLLSMLVSGQAHLKADRTDGGIVLRFAAERPEAVEALQQLIPQMVKERRARVREEAGLEERVRERLRERRADELAAAGEQDRPERLRQEVQRRLRAAREEAPREPAARERRQEVPEATARRREGVAQREPGLPGRADELHALAQQVRRQEALIGQLRRELAEVTRRAGEQAGERQRQVRRQGVQPGQAPGRGQQQGQQRGQAGQRQMQRRLGQAPQWQARQGVQPGRGQMLGQQRGQAGKRQMQRRLGQAPQFAPEPERPGGWQGPW